jgi:DNA invertase Pin-like site-specific DNA recombinase
MKAFVAYYRVSTRKQGADGYGMTAQKEAVQRYLATLDSSELIASFEEVESGANNDRPQLTAAIQLAKTQKATLIIAKLDRISRNASFLMQLQDSGVEFVATDMPSADRFTVSILACVAQRERELISQRTKAGLAVAKARGVVLGNPKVLEARQAAQKAIQTRKKGFTEAVLKSIREIQSTGVKSLNKTADCLNKRGEKSPRGGKWTAMTVKRVLACS